MNAYINDSERFGAFQPIGARAVCNGGGYMIQVAKCGQAARYQLICEDRVKTRGRWQDIRCTPTGRPYIIDYVRRCRLYFENFMNI